MTDIGSQLSRLKEQEDAKDFINRPSLRLAREKAAEKEVDALLAKIYEYDESR